jgi:hypothetical protein
MKSLPHSKIYYVSITKTNLCILYEEIRSSFSLDVTQRELVVTGISGQPLGPIFKDHVLDSKLPHARYMFQSPNFL